MNVPSGFAKDRMMPRKFAICMSVQIEYDDVHLTLQCIIHASGDKVALASILSSALIY